LPAGEVKSNRRAEPKAPAPASTRGRVKVSKNVAVVPATFIERFCAMPARVPDQPREVEARRHHPAMYCSRDLSSRVSGEVSGTNRRLAGTNARALVRTLGGASDHPVRGQSPVDINRTMYSSRDLFLVRCIPRSTDDLRQQASAISPGGKNRSRFDDL